MNKIKNYLLNIHEIKIFINFMTLKFILKDRLT
jgi:hypothetical protein